MPTDDEFCVFELPYGQEPLVLKASQLAPEQLRIFKEQRRFAFFAVPRITKETLGALRDELSQRNFSVRRETAVQLGVPNPALGLNHASAAARELMGRVIDLLEKHDLFEHPRP